MKFWPVEVEHGWIVGASVVDTDIDPSVFTRKGAESLAARLNHSQADQARADERQRIVERLLHAWRGWRWCWSPREMTTEARMPPEATDDIEHCVEGKNARWWADHSAYWKAQADAKHASIGALERDLSDARQQFREQLAVAVKALRAARQCILATNPQDGAGFYDAPVQVALDQIDDSLRGAE